MRKTAIGYSRILVWLGTSLLTLVDDSVSYTLYEPADFHCCTAGQ